MGIHCADHVTPSIRKKLALTSQTYSDHSVGTVHLQTKDTEFLYYYIRIGTESTMQCQLM
jgi:hypothetical protein